MDDAVAVALKIGAGRRGSLRIEATPALAGIYGENRAVRGNGRLKCHR
jgi:hypothetical protein